MELNSDLKSGSGTSTSRSSSVVDHCSLDSNSLDSVVSNTHSLINDDLESNCRPLVEAPMESPLNLAHTFSRRADILSKNKKYEEAIVSHRKAAEYLLEAMQHNDNSDAVQESLALQHKTYLSEIDRLQQKNQILQFMDRTTKHSSVISQATQTDNINNNKRVKENMMTADIYEVLRENKELMKKLKINHADNAEHAKVNNARNQSVAIEGSRKVKYQSIDEVIEMNKKLTMSVNTLLKEMEDIKSEKRLMTKKIIETGKSVRLALDDKLNFQKLDLPPLEESFPLLTLSKFDS